MCSACEEVLVLNREVRSLSARKVGRGNGVSGGQTTRRPRESKARRDGLDLLVWVRDGGDRLFPGQSHLDRIRRPVTHASVHDASLARLLDVCLAVDDVVSREGPIGEGR